MWGPNLYFLCLAYRLLHSKLSYIILKVEVWSWWFLSCCISQNCFPFCSGKGVPEGAGLEEPLHWVWTGGVHVPHWEDKGSGPQGDSWEHEGGALAALLWWASIQYCRWFSLTLYLMGPHPECYVLIKTPHDVYFITDIIHLQNPMDEYTMQEQDQGCFLYLSDCYVYYFPLE